MPQERSIPHHIAQWKLDFIDQQTDSTTAANRSEIKLRIRAHREHLMARGS